MESEQPIREWVRDGFGGTEIKREVGVHREYIDLTRQWGRRHESESLLVGMNDTRIRLRYPRGTQSRVQYLEAPSQTLQQLTALWICNLLPCGVLADVLEEETSHVQAAQILREWDRVKGQEVKP